MLPASAAVQFETRIHRLEYLLNVHYLEVPPEVIQQLGGKLNVRLLCTINNSLSFQCGLMALKHGYAYITLNTKRLKQLHLRQGDKVHVALEKDESEYGVEVPEELSELFAQDEEGKMRFDKLTAGMRRYLINYVGTVKSTQLRIDRAVLVISNLKQLPPGKEEYRAIVGIKK